MLDTNNPRKKLIWAYLPFISQEDVRRTNEIIQSFRGRYEFKDVDYEQITVAHNFIFRRLFQIDPVLRRRPPSPPGVPTPQFFTTLDKAHPKGEAKLQLVTIHRLLDKYCVPQAERKEFFKALTTAWYYVRLAAKADLDAECIGMLQ